MKNTMVKAFAVAAGLGIALNTGAALAMPDNRDYFEPPVMKMFSTTACTKDGYSVTADIGVNPSVLDLARKNKDLPRNTKIVIDEFTRLAGGENVLQKEVDSLWQEIVGQLAREDFIRPPAKPAPAQITPARLQVADNDEITIDPDELRAQMPYYSENLLRVAPAIAPKYQQRIENITSGISVLFLHTGPARGEREWNPAKGCQP